MDNSALFVIDGTTIVKYLNNLFTFTIKGKVVFDISKKDIDDLLKESDNRPITPKDYLIAGMAIYMRWNIKG